MKDNRVNYFAVRGFYKSGTVWVQNILNLHPKIFIRGEYNFQFLRKSLDCYFKKYNKEFVEQFRGITNKYYELIVKECMSHNVNKPNVCWFGDRTPVGILPVFLENCPHFFIYRDGRDILISQIYHVIRCILSGIIKFENFPRVKKFKSIKEKIEKMKRDKNYFIKFPKELLDNEEYVKFVARDWTNVMEKNLRTIKKIKSGLINIRLHMIKYEDLHGNTEKERKSMYKFLNLDPEMAKPLDKMTTPGFESVDNMSHFRKGIVGDWRNYFTEDTCKWFKEEAGNMLVRMGYEKDNLWTNNIDL